MQLETAAIQTEVLGCIGVRDEALILTTANKINAMNTSEQA